jgi:hypothetical protein
MSLLLILSLAVFLLSCMMIARGLHGRRIDDHPLCRRCGFDLTGRPEDSTRCSECGALLNDTRSIRIGHRQRRGPLIAIGMALLLPSLALLAGIIFVRAGNVDLTQYKPVWLLRRDLDAGVSAQGAALKELARRSIAGKLSAAQAAGVADRALAILTTPTWQPAAAFIEAAHAGNLLDTPRWTAYARQATAIALQVRPTVRQGDPVPIAVNLVSPRIAAAGFVALFDWSDLRIDGVPAGKLPDARWANFGKHDGKFDMGSGRYGSSYHNPEINGTVSRGLSPGPHNVSVTLKLHLYNAADLPNYNGSPAPPPDPAKELAAFDLPLKAAFTICDAEHEPPATISDESLRPAVEAAVKVQSLMATAPGVNLSTGFNQPPVRFSFVVYLRPEGGQEIKTDIAQSCPPKANYGYGSVTRTALGPATRADVIFRPDLDAARASVDNSPIWGREIIVRNVPVTQPAGTK